MVFVWRGSGITVPIFLFISGWIVSFWIEDDRVGNPDFMGWTLLWAGIVLALQGLAVWGGQQPDPETGEVHVKKGHDFFWIPVFIWGIGFIGLSIYLLNKEPAVQPELNYDFTEVYEDPNAPKDRVVNFYNPTDDTIFIEMRDARTKEEIVSAPVPPRSTRFSSFDFKRYDLLVDGEKERITVAKSKKRKEFYQEEWYILGGTADLVLVDVTEACDIDFTMEDLENIDWVERVAKRYSGDEMIEPFLNSTRDRKRIIYGVGDKLPTKLKKKEYIFSLIPVPAEKDLDEDYLKKKVSFLCFSDIE